MRRADTLKSIWYGAREFAFSFEPKDRPLIFIIGLVFLYYFFEMITTSLNGFGLKPLADSVSLISYAFLIFYILVWADPLSEVLPKEKKEENLNERSGL